MVKIEGATMAPPAHPVDALLPPGKLIFLAFQHVLTMYAGAVTVPILIGSALHLGADQTAYLVSSDLLACGLITLLQCLGAFGVGVKFPIVMGVTFVALGPSIAIASNPSLGLPGVFGATLVSGVAGLFIAPVFSRLSGLFAPVVTGTAMILIGLSLFAPAIAWASGGLAGPGDPVSMGLAALVILTILIVVRFGRGFLANMAVLIGIAIGFAASTALGGVDVSIVGQAQWLAVVAPLHFGAPKFDLLAAVSMTVVMLVTMVESSGMMFALSRIIDKPLDSKQLARGLRADAVGAFIGGLFNSLPYTSYAQNVAMVSMTGVRSRFVCAAAGLILVLLGCIPKLSYLVTAIPKPVLGGAALVMFSMVAANGVQTLGRIDFTAHRKSLYVVAVSLGVGMIPGVAPQFFDRAPPQIATFLHNGVLIGILTAVILNLLMGDTVKDSGADA